MGDSIKTGSDEFGELLRTARERLGVSRRELAVSTGLSYPYISQLETGYRTPSASAMRSLADALDLPPDVLFAAIPHDRGPASPASAPEPMRSGGHHTPRPRSAPAPAPRPAAVGARGISVGHAAVPTPPEPADSAPLPSGGPPPGEAAAPSPASAGARAVAGTAGAGDWFANPHHVQMGGRVVDQVLLRSATPTSGAVVADEAAVPTASAAVEAPTAVPSDAIEAPPGISARDRAVTEAARLLTSLPHRDRLPAVGEVQARVVQSVVEDRVRQVAADRRR